MRAASPAERGSRLAAPIAGGFAAGVVRGEHLTMRTWEYAARVGVPMSDDSFQGSSHIRSLGRTPRSQDSRSDIGRSRQSPGHLDVDVTFHGIARLVW
jgi:hypothetical protein